MLLVLYYAPAYLTFTFKAFNTSITSIFKHCIFNHCTNILPQPWAQLHTLCLNCLVFNKSVPARFFYQLDVRRIFTCFLHSCLDLLFGHIMNRESYLSHASLQHDALFFLLTYDNTTRHISLMKIFQAFHNVILQEDLWYIMGLKYTHRSPELILR